MPTFKYSCSSCHAVHEVLQKMSDAPISECPSCGKATLTKLLPTSFGVQFKGSGFYETDYKKPSCCGSCSKCEH